VLKIDFPSYSDEEHICILTLLSYGEVCKSSPRPGHDLAKHSRINPRKKTTRSADQSRQTSSDLGLFTCSLPKSGPPMPNDACNEYIVSQRYSDMNRALTLIHRYAFVKFRQGMPSKVVPCLPTHVITDYDSKVR
jgi:hypothetical protein